MKHTETKAVQLLKKSTVNQSYKSSCIGCHGGDLGGQGMGPALTGGLDAEHVKDVVMNGQGAMPAVVTNEAEAQAVADYIAGLE